jgi:hypothetical protein
MSWMTAMEIASPLLPSAYTAMRRPAGSMDRHMPEALRLLVDADQRRVSGACAGLALPWQSAFSVHEAVVED